MVIRADEHQIIEKFDFQGPGIAQIDDFFRGLEVTEVVDLYGLFKISDIKFIIMYSIASVIRSIDIIG